MSAPTISILMPIYNARSTLEASVASVLDQSCPDWELLMIEDGSTDGSAALAAHLAAGDPRLRLLCPGGNRGAAQARNHGLEHARGRYIGFLDADDRWHRDKLARQLAFMRATGVALSYTGCERVTPEGRLIVRQAVPEHLDYAAMLGPNRISCLTAIYDSARLGRQPMPDLPLQHDYGLWLRLLRIGGPAAGLNEVLASYRVGRGSLSSSKIRAVRDIWRVWRREERLGLLTSLGALRRYVLFSLRHRLVQRPSRRSDAR